MPKSFVREGEDRPTVDGLRKYLKTGGLAADMPLRDWFAARAPDWWVKEKVGFLRQLEFGKMESDESRQYQMQDDIVLIAQAQYEYADAMLKEQSKNRV